MSFKIERTEVKTVERVLKALANKRRLAILISLRKNKEMTVGGIATAIKLSYKATSRHLAVLAGADLLDREQRKLEVYYCISSSVHIFARYLISIL